MTCWMSQKAAFLQDFYLKFLLKVVAWLPLMMDCDLQSESKTLASSKVFLAIVFYHSNGTRACLWKKHNKTRTCLLFCLVSVKEIHKSVCFFES